MILRRMTASFGCLDRRTLELAPGLNLIEAPNESGKSTWCAFLRAMLYGIDTGQRAKKGTLPDKKRYQPWTGVPMEGSLSCELSDGRVLTVQRGTSRAAAPLGDCVVRDEAGEVLDLGPRPGLTLLGVEEAVFTRSAFIDAGAMAVEADAALEKRILTLLSDGEETMGREQADDTLRQWQNARRANRSTGRLPQIEAELADTERRLSELQAAAGRVAGARTERDALRRQKAVLDEQVRAHIWYEQAERYEQAQIVHKEYTALESELTRVRSSMSPDTPDREELSRLRDEFVRLQALREPLNEPEAPCPVTEEAIAERRERLDRLETDLRRFGELSHKSFPLLPVLFLILTVVCLGLGFLLPFAPLRYAGLGCLVVMIVTVALRLRQNGQNWREREELLERWRITEPEELTPMLEKERGAIDSAEVSLALWRGKREERLRLEEYWREQDERLRRKIIPFAPGEDAEEAVAIRLALRARLERLTERQAVLSERLDDLGDAPAPEGEQPPRPEGSRQAAEQERDRIALRLRELDTLLARADGERSTLGDPAALQAREAELLERRDALVREWDAIALAREALQEAHGEMSARFSPQLNETATAIFHQLTGGRYEALTLDRTLEAVVRQREDLLDRSALSLSRGALDQLYLAVRLAICHLVLPPDTPLILDDALAHFDEMRMGHALEYLMTEKRQILLFTCHAREGRYLEGRSEVHRTALG